MKNITCLISIIALFVVCGCEHKNYLYRTGVSINSASMKELSTALEHEPLKYVETNGSAASLRLLQKGLLDFAVVRNDILNKSNEDQIKAGVKTVYAAVANVVDETCYLIARKDSDITNIFDLKGKKVAIGRKDHGTNHVAGNIFNAHGFKSSLITPVYAPFEESSEMLISGEIDALFCVDIFPSPNIKALSEKLPIKLITLDEDAIKPLLSYKRGYFLRQIPKGTFKGQDSEVTAIKVNSVLMTHQNVPDSVIKNLILELAKHNLSKQDTSSESKHPNQQLKKQLAQMCKKNYYLKYHPAAAKLYDEYGIEVETFQKNVSLNTTLIGQD